MVASLDSSTENLTVKTKNKKLWSWFVVCNHETFQFTCMPIIFNCPRLQYFVIEGEREIREIGSEDFILVNVDW